MPRIDPEQLLNCLQVLLTPSGGILSKDEVQRLANLMTKFSKKLVSKCIYVLILKNTDRHLLGSFMAEGGWNLIHIWLQDAQLNKNWALVTEVLELLLITPVDVERLKMNNLPKLVKSLTKRDDLAGVQKLATTLVEEWLKIVKDVTKAEAAEREAVQAAVDLVNSQVQESMDVESGNSENSENTDSTNSSLRFKVALKDGKQVISKIDSSEDGNSVPASEEGESAANDDADSESKEDKKREKSNHERNKSRSNSSSSKSSSSSKDRERSRDKSKSSSGSRSSSSRDKDRKDKHRSSSSKHRSSSSSKSSSSGGKDRKEKQAEKDKDTLAKIQPQVLQKLGRIPRKPEDKGKPAKKDDVKKPTFSVEVRKSNEEKPKTVKIFNSKMRSTGLLEEAKPPPPRTTAKKPTPTVMAVVPVKRPSPIREVIPPPEKKSRLMDVSERPGSIKLIPPKPKPAALQESDIFMDALTASATMKKEPKKRKRRPSSSKDASPPSSPNHSTPTSPSTNIKNITPANFYQDTLDAENDEDKDKENQAVENERVEEPDTPAEPDDDQKDVETTRTDCNGLRGVLSYSKRKGPKRTLRWKADADLVEIQYFELDETERVNVMKPFMDMARMEMSNERETMRARKLQNEDLMDSQMPWRAMIEMDLPPPQAVMGSKSLEKDIQFAREKRVLQALYFHKPPDAPAEPENETHPLTNPIIIPLDDPENPETDAVLQPWPEPKGSPPHVPNVPPIFPPGLPGPPFMNMPPGGFPPTVVPPFPPGFMPPNMMRPPGPEWNGMPNMVNGIPNGMPPPNMAPPDMMNQCPPNMFDGFVPNMGDNGFVPPPFQPPNNMPMFPPNNFNNNNGNMRGRGGFRRGNNNNGPWVRMGGPGQGWNRGGGPNRGGRFCINVKKHGYCRNRDNCPFVHPN